MARRYGRFVVCLALLGPALAGCTSPVQAATPEKSQPAEVAPIPGSDRSQVVLTADAASRVGISTEPVAAASGGARHSAIPLAAVLYDKDGATWVYTEPRRLTFVPEQVVIAHIDGDTAELTSGPPVGTEVVIVGGAEPLGAEYGVPGEQ